MGRLNDRSIIVTGAAQGIGAVYAKGLAAEGASLTICDLTEPRKVADEIRAAGHSAAALLPEIRHEVEEWWIDLDFTDDKMAAVERLKAVVQGLAY